MGWDGGGGSGADGGSGAPRPARSGVVATARALLAEAVLLLDHEPRMDGEGQAAAAAGTPASSAAARDPAVAEPLTPTRAQALEPEVQPL